jgi:ABC-type transport system involved in cytochrome bd biosynthesis fused ATPase/permease subunit
MAALQSKLATAVANIEEWITSDITNKFADGLAQQEERIELSRAKTDKVTALANTTFWHLSHTLHTCHALQTASSLVLARRVHITAVGAVMSGTCGSLAVCTCSGRARCAPAHCRQCS